jgi:hypothetical protein
MKMSAEAKQIQRELRVAQRARQAKHGSVDTLFVDEVGQIAKRLAEQLAADGAPNAGTCEHCGSLPGTPCPEWC